MEYILLGVDSIILGLCIKDYLSFKRTTNALKTAQELPLNDNLKEYVSNQPEKKIDYVVVRGTVRPIGAPIKSVMAPSVTGVLQLIKLNEHQVTRGFAGFWTEQDKLMHVSTSEVPFTVNNGRAAVEIIDGLTAEVLDLDVVHDSYEPATPSFFDHLFGFFMGVRQRGIQTTEEMLRDGSFITAVGEIEVDGNALRLQTSSVGPLLLSTATRKALIKRYDDIRRDSFFRCVVFGGLAAIMIGVIVRRAYLKRKQLKEDEKIAIQLEKNRQERRARNRPTVVPDDQQCVICLTNPKEIICIPCGHVCMCEDCSKKVRKLCPVCRVTIESRSAAFIV